MFSGKRNICLSFIIFSAILFIFNPGYAKNSVRNVTVQVNKPEIVLYNWVVDTSFDKDKKKCLVSKPPDMVLRKKPEFGTVKFKKGVVIDNDKLSEISRKICKDKVIKATVVEFTSNKKGKVSFVVEVFYREGRYEEHIFGNVLFNVNVR